VAVTKYSERQHGDPDVQVGFTFEGQQVTGFIDARRQTDGIWEAWVWFSYEENGWRATRKDWARMDDLTVLTVDDEPLTPPNQPGEHLEQPDGPPADA
jgi:hypothetical protein